MSECSLLQRYYLAQIYTFVLLGALSAQNLHIESISTYDGLLANTVNCVIQDRLGYIWIGTTHGLNRFDGYTFSNYTYKPHNANSLIHNVVLSLCEDPHGNLWIGTQRGVAKLDSLRSTFTGHGIGDVQTIAVDKDSSVWFGTSYGLSLRRNQDGKWKFFDDWQKSESRLPYNKISKIYKDDSERLWAGTYGGGLIQIKANKSGNISFSTLPSWIGPNSGNQSVADTVHSMLQDSWGRLFVGTSSGLKRLNASARALQDCRLLSDSKIYSMIEADGNHLWFASDDGLYRLNITDTTASAHERLQYFKGNSDYGFNVRDYRASGLLVDHSGILWIAANGIGLGKVVTNKTTFYHAKYVSKSEQISSAEVLSIFQGRDQSLWAGNKTGLHRLKFADEQKSEYSLKRVGFAATNKQVVAIVEDDSQNIWCAANGEGVFKYNYLRNSTSWHQASTLKDSLKSNNITALLREPDGTIWLASKDSIALYQYDNANKRFVPATYFSTIALAEKHILTITGGVEPHLLWLGTKREGIIKFNKQTSEFTKLVGDPNYPKDWDPTVPITVFLATRSGTLWIGTGGRGLYRLHIEGQSHVFGQVNTKQGLNGNYIYGLQEDNSGTIWIASNKGVSKLDQSNATVKNYAAAEGLHEIQFQPRVSFVDSGGQLVFGGQHEILTFYPQNDICLVSPRLLFLGFTHANHPKVVNPSPIISPKTEVPFDNAVVSASFRPLHYKNPEGNTILTKLRGIEQEWQAWNPRADIRYSDLAPGNYVMEVRAANSDGIQSHESTLLEILVHPPWWMSTYAYFVYGLIVISASILFAVYRRRRLQYRNTIVEANRVREVEQLKSRFFANISHDFRTPLTLIQGPINSLIRQTTSKKAKEQLAVILNNANVLNGFVDNLLYISRLEAGQVPLRLQTENIISLIDAAVSPFAEQASREKIRLMVRVSPQSYRTRGIFLQCDRDQLQAVLLNLLSNAFKYTPRNGMISVGVTLNESVLPNTVKSGEQQQNIEIAVVDSGLGIAPEYHDRIFDRYTKLDTPQFRGKVGFGIGLALAKEIINLHNGTLTVDSNANQGSSFTLTLPIVSRDLSDSQLDHTVSFTALNSTGQMNGNKLAHPREKSFDTTNISTGAKRRLLIVEDDLGMLEYISSILQAEYLLYLSNNPDQGWRIASQEPLDLIVSDVRMPVMDGFEFCRKLKNDQQTSHIPIILLTARISEESRILGRHSGADDYITKPFSTHIIRASIENLIENRQLLREKFSREIIVQPHKITATPLDEQFLNSAIQIVEKNLDNPDFNVDHLARELGFERRQLLRKVRALTNHGPGAFIRSLRLKRAAQLLEQQSDTVTQISFAVGFKNPSHFSKCFREEFDRSPSEFTQKRS